MIFFVLSFSNSVPRQALPRKTVLLRPLPEQDHLLPVVGLVGISIFPRPLEDNMIACFVGWEAQFDGIEDSIGFDKNYLARAVSADSIGAWLQICRFHSYVASVHNSTVFLVYVESTARRPAILTPLIHTG